MVLVRGIIIYRRRLHNFSSIQVTFETFTTWKAKKLKEKKEKLIQINKKKKRDFRSGKLK